MMNALEAAAVLTLTWCLVCQYKKDRVEENSRRMLVLLLPHPGL